MYSVLRLVLPTAMQTDLKRFKPFCSNGAPSFVNGRISLSVFEGPDWSRHIVAISQLIDSLEKEFGESLGQTIGGVIDVAVDWEDYNANLLTELTIPPTLIGTLGRLKLAVTISIYGGE